VDCKQNTYLKKIKISVHKWSNKRIPPQMNGLSFKDAGYEDTKTNLQI